MQRPLAALLLGLVFACPPRAHAATVVVPDDYPTLQQAVDAPAETVLVRSGDYPERVTVHREDVWQTLIAAHPANPPGARPRIAALTLHVEEPQTIVGLHVLGGLFMHNHQGDGLSFTDCVLDSGAIQLSVGDNGYPGSLGMVRCRVKGSVSAIIHGGYFDSDTIVGGGLVMDGEMGLAVRRCVFQGNGTGTAIRTLSHAGQLTVEESRIEDYVLGIVVRSSSNDFHAECHRTIFRRCSDSGIRVGGSSPRLSGNDVADCGVGLDVYAEYGARVSDNRVVGCVGAGIAIQGGGDGFECTGNVVGRSGDGISIRTMGSDALIRGNTTYFNARSGLYVLFGGDPDRSLQVDHNIAFANQGHGLLIETDQELGGVRVECNDWFANALGSVSGIPSGSLDLEVDPRFCAVLEDFVHLASDSPLLDAPGCGRIGALSLGCMGASSEHATITTPCDPRAWSPIEGTDGARISGVYAHPTGSLELEAPPAGLTGFRRSVDTAFPLKSLTELGVDLLRDASSTTAADHAPAVRLLVDNGKAADRYSWLMWEPRWNGVTLAPDTWSAFDLLSGRFWQSAIGEDGKERTIDVYDRTLADWLSKKKITDADGDVSHDVGPDATVREVQIVVAGGAGAFRGAADNLSVGGGGTVTRFDFESVRLPQVVMDGATPRVACGTPVLLEVVILPASVTGPVEFFDGEISLGTAPVEYGRARLQLAPIGPGPHTFRARYSGDGCVAPGGSTDLVVESVPYPTTMNVTLPNAVVVGSRLTLQAQVIPTAAAGEVEFSDATGVLGRAPTAGGRASLEVDAGVEDVRTISAHYLGFGCHTASSATVPLHVVAELPTLSVSDATAGESDGLDTQMTFTVSLSHAVQHEVRVDYVSAAGTAQPTADFWAVAGTLIFTPGTTRVPLVVPIRGDVLNEPDETLFVMLARPNGAVLADSVAQGLILDEDRPRMSVQSLTVFEGTGSVTLAQVDVRLVASSLQPQTVSYRTQDVSARADAGDYVPIRGDLAFAPLEALKTLFIEVAADSAYEETETFRLVLTTTANGEPLTESVVISIRNDDPTPGIFIADASVSEAAGSPRLQAFRVWLSNPNANGTVRVSYATVDGTAKSAADYTPASGYCQIPPNGREAWIEVPITGDRACESSESYSVKISAAFNGVIRDDTAEGVILDDDCTTPTLVSLLRAEPTPQGIEVRWQFADAGAVAAVTLERGPAPAGPWTAISAEIRDDDGVTVALDRDPRAGTYWYRVVARDREGAEEVFGPISATATAAAEFGLGRITPNPSRAAVAIEFAVAREAGVRLAVVDVQGREMAVLANGVHGPGRYVARWNGEDEGGRVPAGLYFVRYHAAGRSWTKRLAMTH